MERPNRIASVNYIGRRNGTISALHKRSSFTRKDTLLITGYTGGLSKLSIEGVYYGSGFVRLHDPQKFSIQRSYNLKLTYLNISINKSILQNTKQVFKQLRGALKWQLQITSSPLGDSTNVQTGINSTSMSGTIQLVGDGTALLRFQSVSSVYQINLYNGEVTNINKAFEGRVSSVNLSMHQFELLNGLNVNLLEDAVITGMEYQSLQAVQNAISNNIHVWAKGKGSLQQNKFNAESVIFMSKEKQGTPGVVPFHAKVTSANINARTFTVANQYLIHMTQRTVIDKQSDYLSLKELSGALRKRETVLARGTVRGIVRDTLSSTGTQNFIIAIHIGFYDNSKK